MADRISILKYLQTFGPVEHFRNLKHHPRNPDPHAFHAILSAPTAAENILQQSPLKFTQPNDNLLDEDQDPEAAEQGEQTQWTLLVSRSFHDFAKAARTNPLFGPFRPVEARYSVVASELGKRMAREEWTGIAKKGLCDWSTDDPADKAAWGEGADVRQRKEGVDSMPWRIRRRLQTEREVPLVDVLGGDGKERQNGAGNRRSSRNGEAFLGGKDVDGDRLDKRKPRYRPMEGHETVGVGGWDKLREQMDKEVRAKP
jgi:hypothetical protein